MWIICLNVSHAQACRPSPICTFAKNLEHKKWGCVIMMSDAVHWFFDLTVLGLECDALDSMAASRTKLKVGVVLCATGPIIFSISHSSKNFRETLLIFIWREGFVSSISLWISSQTWESAWGNIHWDTIGWPLSSWTNKVLFFGMNGCAKLFEPPATINSSHREVNNSAL